MDQWRHLSAEEAPGRLEAEGLSGLSNEEILSGGMSFLGLQLLFTYAPFRQTAFHTESIGPADWLMILAVALAAIVIIEIEKFSGHVK